MITITKEAATLLTALKIAEGAPDEAGIRIHRRGVTNGSGELAVEFDITDNPASDDEEFEQEGLRIYVEDALVATLDGSILDVQYASEGPELVWR
jgi:Fe-S cluster assembly iron-binding protein IscA